MRKIVIAILILVLLIVYYFGFVRKGLCYYTGIGTSYSYFQAQEAKHDSILVLYRQELISRMCYINDDSLRLQYGFAWKFGGIEVSYSVIQLYNSVIEKELLRRLGEDKWNEYLFKLDSMEKRVNRIYYSPPRRP